MACTSVNLTKEVSYQPYPGSVLSTLPRKCSVNLTQEVFSQPYPESVLSFLPRKCPNNLTQYPGSVLQPYQGSVLQPYQGSVLSTLPRKCPINLTQEVSYQPYPGSVLSRGPPPGPTSPPAGQSGSSSTWSSCRVYKPEINYWTHKNLVQYLINYGTGSCVRRI